MLDFLTHGITHASLWQIVAIFFVATQLTVLSVTLYLHRCQAHRGLDLHPLVTHPMRLWLWMSTGMVTREWVAVHRKHHARCETDEDPHSPQTHGIVKVLWHGVSLYQKEAVRPETLEKYGHGCPDDWVERNLYTKRSWLGPTLLLLINVSLFGALGLSFWALQMIWIPLTAAGVINGLGHWWGYRNFNTDDTSHNLIPVTGMLGGEELHNNHHAFPSSAKFALRPWEFDIGWAVIRGLEHLGLAKVRRLAPRLERDEAKQHVDDETLSAVFAHRWQVMTDYCRRVVAPVVRDEAARADSPVARMRRQARRVLSGNANFFSERRRRTLEEVLENSAALATIYEYRMRLQAIWDRSSTDPEQLLEALRTWCREAEQSGIRALEDFSRQLAGYKLVAST